MWISLNFSKGKHLWRRWYLACIYFIANLRKIQIVKNVAEIICSAFSWCGWQDCRHWCDRWQIAADTSFASTWNSNSAFFQIMEIFHNSWPNQGLPLSRRDSVKSIKRSSYRRQRKKTATTLDSRPTSFGQLSSISVAGRKAVISDPSGGGGNNHILFPLLRRCSPIEGFVGRSLVSKPKLRLSVLRTFASFSQVINISENFAASRTKCEHRRDGGSNHVLLQNARREIKNGRRRRWESETNNFLVYSSQRSH